MSVMFDIFKKHIHSPSKIIDMAINKALPPEKTAAVYIKKNFSNLVSKIQDEAYRTYLESEKHAGKIAMEEYLSSIISPKTGSKEAIACAASKFEEFDKFFLSLSQSRKPRAGGAFEDIIKALFKHLKYPFQEQQVINGKPDFLMPNIEHYKNNAMDCIIFTAKRTLRERWRQIVTEGTRGLGFYLATIDEEVTEQQLDEMKRNRIYLVMPASFKKRIEHYSEALNVISFEEFFSGHLDPALRRWKKSKIV